MNEFRRLDARGRLYPAVEVQAGDPFRQVEQGLLRHPGVKGRRPRRPPGKGRSKRPVRSSQTTVPSPLLFCPGCRATPFRFPAKSTERRHPPWSGPEQAVAHGLEQHLLPLGHTPHAIAHAYRADPPRGPHPVQSRTHRARPSDAPRKEPYGGRRPAIPPRLWPPRGGEKTDRK